MVYDVSAVLVLRVPRNTRPAGGAPHIDSKYEEKHGKKSREDFLSPSYIFVKIEFVERLGP